MNTGESADSPSASHNLLMAALYYQWRDKQPKETADAAEEFQAEIGENSRFQALAV